MNWKGCPRIPPKISETISTCCFPWVRFEKNEMYFVYSRVMMRPICCTWLHSNQCLWLFPTSNIFAFTFVAELLNGTVLLHTSRFACILSLNSSCQSVLINKSCCCCSAEQLLQPNVVNTILTYAMKCHVITVQLLSLVTTFFIFIVA